MNTRDKSLDRLRGFAMLWVIVVHVLYWGFFFSNSHVQMLMSFGLFEMPLFFFITGASNRFSREDRYGAFVFKRFRRVLIPYWVFALLCAVLSVVKYSAEGTMNLLTAGKILLSWLIPADRQMTSVPYLTWALWFVPVYLCIVPVLPLFLRVRRCRWNGAFGALLLAIFAGSCLLKLTWLQTPAFYAMWTYIGLFYGEITAAAKQKKNRRFLLAAVGVGAAAIAALYLAGVPVNMQHNKFPPTLVFLIYSAAAMAGILLVHPQLDRLLAVLEAHKLTAKLFALYSRRSMTVFLYQVFAFQLTIPLTNWLIPGSGLPAEAAKFLFCLAVTVPLCGALAACLGRIEDIGSRK